MFTPMDPSQFRVRAVPPMEPVKPRRVWGKDARAEHGPGNHTLRFRALLADGSPDVVRGRFCTDCPYADHVR